MADNTIFSAEFDTSGVTKGAEAAVQALTKQAQAETTLSEAMQASQEAIQAKNQELKTLQGSLDAAAKSNTALTKSESDLNKQLENSEKQYKALQETFQQQAAALNAFKSQNEGIKGSIDKTTASINAMKDAAGKPINVNPSIAQLNTLTQKFKSSFEQLRGFYSADAFGALEQDVKDSANNINVLRSVIDGLRKDLGESQAGSTEFNAIAEAVRTATAALQQYDTIVSEATTNQEPKFQSLRSRIKDLRNELTRLEEQGLEESEQYKKTQIQAARLTDQYSDMQQQIRALASDTKYLDFGVAGVQAALAGYQLLSGAFELFGASSEEAAEAQRKLLAIS